MFTIPRKRRSGSYSLLNHYPIRPNYSAQSGCYLSQPRPCLGFGGIYGRQCDTDKALDDFERAIQLDPNLAPAYTGRGSVMLSRGETTRAIADATAAMQINSGFAPAYLLRAAGYTRTGDLDRAMSDVGQALRLE